MVEEQKIFHLCKFLEEDIKRLHEGAFLKAWDEGWRTAHRLEKLAEETSLEISQLLLDAKKEFGEKDDRVSQGVLKRVGELEGCDGVEVILNELRERLGIALVDRMRGNTDHRAFEQAREKAKLLEPEIAAIVIEELNQLEMR